METLELNKDISFDVYKLREQFPILNQRINGKPLVYFDIKKILISLTIIFLLFNICFSQETGNFKAEDFGLHAGPGGIDISRMTKKQLDTIVICPINYEDQLPDICICSNSKKEIIIYRCLGNGLFDVYKTIALVKKAVRMTTSLPKDYPVSFSPFYDLKITYSDGSEQTMYNYKINSFDTEPKVRIPKWNFLNDARAFVYDFSFIQAWRSERNGLPHRTISLGDIDNDGKNEMVYTFYPVVDSGPPQYRPTRMVIFESIGHDYFIIDWDTIFINGGHNAATDILTDFDRNGKKEFFGESTDVNWNTGTYGLFECSGEKRYRFWGIDDFLFLGTINDVAYVDTMKIVDTTKNPGVWLSFYPSGFPPNIYNRISPYKYVRKYEVFYFGHYEFRTVPDDATNFIRTPWRIDDIDVADIDKDGKDEIALGVYDFTDVMFYYDSTGVNYNMGYEYKSATLGAPASAGWVFTKDFDDDGYNEIIAAGVGVARGSIAIIKHIGLPGENNFAAVWWDSVGLEAQPNWGFDTGTVNGNFTVLYPTVDYHGPRDIENIITYARNEEYSFYKSSYTVLDTTGFIQSKLFDIDKDNGMEIITPVGYGLPPIKQFLGVFKMESIITNSNNNTSSITDFKLNQNYPNPFNPFTIISYQLPVISKVSIKVFNILGKETETLIDQTQNAGTYEVKFDGSDYPSGIYFYSLTINGYMIDKKVMVYIK